MRKRKDIVRLVISIIILGIISYGANTNLQVTKYVVESEKIPEEFNNYKIVQISDYHGKISYLNDKLIIKEINRVKPDIIVMTGDMLNALEQGESKAVKMVESLVDKYPIYAISGNHEQVGEILYDYEYQRYINKIRDLGVNVINNKKVELKKGASTINLYGVETPLDNATALYIDKELLSKSYMEKKLGVIDDNDFNILLAHNPIYIDRYSEWGADLVLSGHMHGGIIRIPFIGGIFSPERTLFPKYTGGRFNVGESTMIVNRGLGSSKMNFRIYNRPELGVIILKKQ